MISKVFWSLNKPFLILCLILLDVLLIFNILTSHENIQSVKVAKLDPITSIKPVRIFSKVSASTVTVILPSVTPTIIITLTPTPTQTPVFTQISTPTSSPQAQSSNTNTQSSSSSSSSLFLSEINAFRASNGLTPVSSNSETCNFAETRANEIVSNFNHDGFSSRASSHSLPYSSYSEVTENIAMNPNPSDVVNAWIASPGHNENMKKNTPFVCVKSNGNFYAYEGLRP